MSIVNGENIMCQRHIKVFSLTMCAESRTLRADSASSFEEDVLSESTDE